MTKEVLGAVIDLGVNQKLKIDLKIDDSEWNTGTVTNLGCGMFKLSVKNGGGKVYGPGADYGTKKFVPAPILGKGQAIGLDIFEEPFIKLHK